MHVNTEAISNKDIQLQQVLRKVKFRLIPLMMLMFALAMLDRSNIGFVKQYLEVDAGISATAYAMGAGIFFIGYALFEVPSNLILHRVGARFWLSRIMVTWGIVSIAMMFVKDQTSFYILRFLLGVAEAGFSPGAILFLTYWFPSAFRSQAYGWFYLGVPIALMLGSPFSGWLLESNMTFGFKNWQWMFLVQGGLTVVVGLIAYVVLVDRPDKAKWLNNHEKTLLNDALKNDQRPQVEAHAGQPDQAKNLGHPHQDDHAVRHVLADWRVWRFILIYFTIQMSVYGVLFYLPSKLAVLLNIHIGLKVGLYNAVPWLLTLLVLPLLTRFADRTRSWNCMAIVMLLCAVLGIGLSTLTSQIHIFLLTISLAVVGFIVVQPIFWNLPTQYLTGKAAAIGTALIGALGNLGGFVAPNLKNWIDNLWQNDIAGLLVLACIGLIGVLLLWSIRWDKRPNSATFQS